MATVEDLKALRYSRLRLEQLRERIHGLEDGLQRITTRYGDGPRGGGAADKTAELTAQIIDLKDRLLRQSVELEGLIQNAEAAIGRLPERQRKILYLRYAEGMSWDKVAKATHYNRQHCMKIHAEALRRMK